MTQYKQRYQLSHHVERIAWTPEALSRDAISPHGLAVLIDTDYCNKSAAAIVSPRAARGHFRFELRGNDVSNFTKEYGNLVILTRDDAGNHTYFRVHQSILSKHSKALSDHIFPGSLPSVRDEYDGVPLVEFQEDAKDLNMFLKFLYEPFAAPLQRGDPDIAFKMFGTLKLADKFLIDPLKDTILSYIREDWPQTLQAWDEREALYARRLKNCPPQITMDGVAPEPASVIRLARMFEPRLLTIAFYHLSRLPANSTYGQHNQAPRHARGVRGYLLTPDDREKVTLGRERMMRWISDRLEAAQLDTWQCKGDEGCHVHIYWRVVVLHRSIMRTMDVLTTLRLMRSHKVERGTSEVVEDAVCLDCNARWDQVINDTRRDFFDSLPAFFPDL
ncbi:hypothetical protein Hypma_013601 [Hypsizygus marmoreus]|uniref:BTB domain-containing protein n=1 Tax=Hypsizygus marmoreus TaxID=39966 RepID=A0A369JC87_HYPMA|nr:hypothetical protein Hypma_013601 [Hypsizygus marmoreus]